MRLAGDAAIVDALSRYFASCSETLPPAKEPISTAESGALEAFMDAHALLRSKGYSEQAASQVATGVARGEQPAIKPTTRFAAVYGDAPGLAAERR